jgi:hypothetical protein
MKNWKHGIIGVLGVIALLLTFSACDDGSGKTHTHTYSTTWSKDDIQHWRECTTNDGAKTDIANHTVGDWIIDQVATETTIGSKHKECTVCGYVTETETIPVTHIHYYGTAWKSNATQHWHECSCGDKIDIATHDWQWLEITAPTILKDGEEARTCTICGEKEIRQIDAFATPFFGTWVFDKDDNIFMEINVNSCKYCLTEENLIYEMVNPIWAYAVNTDAITKDEFSSGFSLNGTWIISNGTESVDNFSLFINAEKNKISYNGDGYDIYNKTE